VNITCMIGQHCGASSDASDVVLDYLSKASVCIFHMTLLLWPTIGGCPVLGSFPVRILKVPAIAVPVAC
jgi:hypothetical protein